MNLLQTIQRRQNNIRLESTTKRHFSYKDGHNFSFYVDLETSGGDPIRNDVIEICILVTHRGKFEVIDKFHSYVRPEQINHITWSKHAESVHGITPAQAEKFPVRRDVCMDLLYFLVPYKHELNFAQLLVCHASASKFFNQKDNELVWAMFDYNFLEWMFRKENLEQSFWKVFNSNYCLSTIWLSKQCGYGEDHLVIDGKPQYTKSGRAKKEGNGLAIWAKRIGFNLEHHKAESDTECCLRVHEHLSKEYDFEGLYNS